ncbi:hypothetical protein [Polyangium sp. y55x31]|uniref:hypothetical protein n=1 Tax=Polyangium sp. y55x31 TaxID=3042688 RepID=UPI002482B894|nr:hypothetical protein [Polyangium sp. y55x31]MDI1475622.1 hypothetical protein [Polyangium sp. y55x31]
MATPVPNNTIILYKDDNTNIELEKIDLTQYTLGYVHALQESKDEATYVRYNLPKGCVVTLFDNHATLDWPNLKGAGRVLDLIGDGQEHAVNLKSCDLNDCASAFLWRNVDLDMGYVCLYEGAEFTGNYTTLFMSEWELDTVHNIDGWHIEDELSSIKWQGMLDTFTVELYENSDGGGRRYTNIARGAGEVRSLDDVGFNDCASAFKIIRLRPVKEEIKEVIVENYVPTNQSRKVVYELKGTNAGSTPIKPAIGVKVSVIETAEVTVTDTHSSGGAVEAGYTHSKVGSDNNALDLTFGFTYNYEHSESSTDSLEKEVVLATTIDYEVPPYSTYIIQWYATSGTVDVTVNTTATRWYTQPLAGTEPDGEYYRRNETLTLSFKGVLCVENAPYNDDEPISST